MSVHQQTIDWSNQMYELISMNYVQFNNFLTPFFLFYQDDVNNFFAFLQEFETAPVRVHLLIF